LSISHAKHAFGMVIMKQTSKNPAIFLSRDIGGSM